jgi:hypothetical protein
LDSTGSGQEPVAGRCECGDELSGYCTTELVVVIASCYFCLTWTLFKIGVLKLFYFDVGKTSIKSC